MTTLLTRIREKVADARPELRGYEFGTRYCSEHTFRTDSDIVIDCAECKPEIDTIRLADILLAIGDDSAANLGGFTRDLLNSGYDLRRDDLEKQSPECWEFLGEILGV